MSGHGLRHQNPRFRWFATGTVLDLAREPLFIGRQRRERIGQKKPVRKECGRYQTGGPGWCPRRSSLFAMVRLTKSCRSMRFQQRLWKTYVPKQSMWVARASWNPLQAPRWVECPTWVTSWVTIFLPRYIWTLYDSVLTRIRT